MSGGRGRSHHRVEEVPDNGGRFFAVLIATLGGLCMSRQGVEVVMVVVVVVVRLRRCAVESISGSSGILKERRKVGQIRQVKRVKVGGTREGVNTGF